MERNEHGGPHNIAIAEGKPRLRKLKKYHGKSGSGIGVEFSLKAGPVTLLSINVDRNGKFRMIAAEGTSIAGDISQTGNTNTRVSFGCDVCDFLARWCEAVPTHHLALGAFTNERDRADRDLVRARAFLRTRQICIFRGEKREWELTFEGEGWYNESV